MAVSLTKTHSRSCLAAAAISAVENMRDGMTLDDLTESLGNGNVLSWALGYLETGTQTCTCLKPAAVVRVLARDAGAEFSFWDLGTQIYGSGVLANSERAELGAMITRGVETGFIEVNHDGDVTRYSIAAS